MRNTSSLQYHFIVEETHRFEGEEDANDVIADRELSRVGPIELSAKAALKGLHVSRRP